MAVLVQTYLLSLCLCVSFSFSLPLANCISVSHSYRVRVSFYSLSRRDNYIVKRQFLHLSTILASQLLLVDEVIRAGKNMGKG